jgi:hypothetical protein
MKRDMQMCFASTRASHWRRVGAPRSFGETTGFLIGLAGTLK